MSGQSKYLFGFLFFIGLMAAAPYMVSDEPKTSVVRRPAHSKGKEFIPRPNEPFLVQLVSTFDHIRSRDKIETSNKELYIDYKNHLTYDEELKHMTPQDVKLIGGICARHTHQWRLLDADPEKLDKI